MLLVKSRFLQTRFSLMKQSAVYLFETYCRSFQTHGLAFGVLRENQKLGRVFEKLFQGFKKLGRMFVF